MTFDLTVCVVKRGVGSSDHFLFWNCFNKQAIVQSGRTFEVTWYTRIVLVRLGHGERCRIRMNATIFCIYIYDLLATTNCLMKEKRTFGIY